MTPSYDGLECTFDADADFMYVLQHETVSCNIIAAPTKNPVYVKLILDSTEDLHELIQSSITKRDEQICISPRNWKKS